MSRKVTYAKLHHPLFIPGIGELGSVFPPQSKTLSGLSMEVDENLNLTLSFKHTGVEREAGVPAATVAGVLYAPKPQAPAVAKGK